MSTVGICALGFVGSAMAKSFEQKGYRIGDNLFVYDKYKNGGIGNFEDLLKTDILFLALPTQYNEKEKSYDLEAIINTCQTLQRMQYSGAVVIKSTVQPNTTENLASRFDLNIIHNPEFLTARTSFDDFHHQKHIVLGRTKNCQKHILDNVVSFYRKNYPDAEISCCTSTESECMKLFTNCFYATKVQFFNEVYLFSQKIGSDYNTIKDLMLKNGWINPMHTNVPGPDGKLSYGGLCFPKDTNALLCQMENLETPHKVLKAVIEERNEMRTDHANFISKS